MTSESAAVVASTTTPVATTPLTLASSTVLTASIATASGVGWWSSISLYTKWFFCFVGFARFVVQVVVPPFGTRLSVCGCGILLAQVFCGCGILAQVLCLRYIV